MKVQTEGLRIAEDNYHNFLNAQAALRRDVEYAKRDVKYAKKELHKAYVIENKRKLLVTDICIVLIVLFNIGALGITNAMVVKNATQYNKTIEFLESNPAQSEINDFKPHPEAKSDIAVFVTQSMMWTFIISCYILRRMTITNDLEFILMLMFVLMYLVVTASDFINDLGYWIGKVVWG